MKKFLLLFAAFYFATLTVNAEIVQKNYSFSNPTITEANGFQTISFENAMLTGISGEPMLPYFSVSLLLPPGHSAQEIHLIPGELVVLEGTYQIYPMQHSQPISKGGSGFFIKKDDVYQKNAQYPETLNGTLSTHFLNGYSVAMSAFTPVRYNPSTGELSYYKSVTVEIVTASDQNALAALSNINSSEPVIERLERLTGNIDLAKTYPQRNSRTDDYDMIIITTNQYADDFEQLVEFYAPRGIIAQVATTETIYSTMPGSDNPMKIRNYIIQEYQDHGIQHVTLGGDVELVPYRGFYCTVQSSSVYTDDNIPSDLYFSGLDGNWNTNGNSWWGEIGEDDLLPEVGIGRFSISNQSDFNALMNKTIQYQENPIPGKLHDPLLAGEWLYSSPETYGSDYLELLIGFHADNGYETTGIPEDNNITKLYEDVQPYSTSDLLQEINEGKSFIHHVGHANSNYTMGLYNEDITNSNFSQVNGVINNYTLAFSHGCICGAFDDNDCIAEKMINIENFAAAVLMNSRYGWFNEGQTEGPAAHLHRELCDALYDKKESLIGMAYSITRIETAPWVNAPGQWEEGALRWNFYDCNVLGDAGLRVWTDEMSTISANYQNALPIGVPSISITISGNGVIEGLNCVFMKDGVMYGKAETNAAGLAEIVFTEPVTNVGDATIFVSGYNCLVHEYPVTVVPNGGAYVVYGTSVVNDVNGNNNGIPEYTESILLTSTMNNVGTVQASNVLVTISSSDPYVTITDNTENFGNIAGGSSATVNNAFAFEIAGNTPNQHAIAFNVQAQGQDTWSSSFSIIVSSPNLEFAGFTISDGASGNGLLDPGETADVIVAVANEGAAEAYDVAVLLSTSDPYITINTTTVQEIGNMGAGINGQAVFSVTASASVPFGHTSIIDVLITAMYGISISDEIQIPFSDYCEATTQVEDEYISNVNFGTINNSSGWQGAVANYTNQSNSMQAGNSQQMVVTNGNAWAADIVTTWVDWNRDMDFGSQTNETFALTNVGGQGQTFNGNITVPANQMPGQYRMRIRMTYSTAPVPCGDATYGEVEDYTLIVTGGVLSVTASCNPAQICQGESSQLMALAGGGSGIYTYSWTPATGLNNPNIYNPVASPEQTTTYTVTVSDGAGSISQQTTLTVHPIPSTPVISQNGNTLTSSSATGNQWYDSDGAINGATGQTYECTWDDSYHVVVTSQFGCESEPSNTIYVVITGIEEVDGNNSLSVYPNPFTDNTKIDFYLENGSNYKITLCNALGQEVKILSEGISTETGKKSIRLITSDLEQGVYFCKLVSDDRLIIRKMIHSK